MKNVVIGSFVGFVLAAAFLAACGSGSGPSGPIPISTPSAVKWSAPGARQIVATGVNLDAGTIWASSATFDNASAGTRNHFFAFEVLADVGGSGAQADVELGVLASADGTSYATEPQWVGTARLRTGDNRRAVVFHALVPPLPFRVALRTAASGVRVLGLSFLPYNEEMQ